MLSLIFISLAAPQAAAPAEATQMDFWLGTWNCEGSTTDATGKLSVQRGTNNISRTLAGKVIHESFEMGGFVGESWTVYDPKAKVWRQTWVDNNGAYIALTGTWKKDRMELRTIPNPGKPMNFNRMIFSHITKDSFDWDWEASTDGGKTWSPAWHLKYTRKKG